MTMYKQELIDTVAENLNWYKSDVRMALNEICGVITDELQHGNKVQITNFGSFDSRTWKAHKIQSIATGKKITIPKRNVPVFKAGDGLKKDVRRKKR